jgi:YVTN family beta-propeller protein
VIGIKDKYAEKWGLGDNQWQEMSFTVVNPTNADIKLDFFNPQISNTFNYPTQPSSVSGAISIIATIPIVTNDAAYCAYNPLNNTVYVSNFITKSVSVIDCTTNLIITSVLVGTTPLGLTYNSQNNRIYVCNNGDNEVGVVDCATNTFLTSIPVGNSPYKIAYNPSSNKMYVTNALSNDVNVIDCFTDTVVATIPVGNTPIGVEYNPLNNRMYVCNSNSSSLSIIDCLTDTVITTLPIGISPKDITYNSLNNTMYISDVLANVVYVLNCVTNLVTDTIAVGLAPSGLSYDTLNNTIYVCNFANNSISVIDCSSNTIIGLPFITNSKPNASCYNSVNKTTYAVDLQNVYVFFQPQTATLYITGDTNYNFAVRDGFNNPFWVDRMYFYSQNADNFNQTFFKVTKDANGNFCEECNTPSLSVSMMQFQSGIGMVKYPNKSLVLGINQWFKDLLIKAQSQITMIFVYQQLEKSYLLSASKNADLYFNKGFDDSVNRRNPIQKFKLEDLNNIMPLNNGEFEITPFSVSNFNNILLNQSNKINSIKE